MEATINFRDRFRRWYGGADLEFLINNAAVVKAIKEVEDAINEKMSGMYAY